MTMPLPYEGGKPYIFISYAHRDSERVMPIITHLVQAGYRVWYDQGIDPGTEWDENIASHVLRCASFIAFVSKAYLKSDNCKDELNYARDLNKERLLVYLEEAQLPAGMAMRINRLQAIHQYTYKSDDAFYEKLFSTPSLKPCFRSPEEESPRFVDSITSRSEIEKERKENNFRRFILWSEITLACIAALIPAIGYPYEGCVCHIEAIFFLNALFAALLSVFAQIWQAPIIQKRLPLLSKKEYILWRCTSTLTVLIACIPMISFVFDSGAAYYCMPYLTYWIAPFILILLFDWITFFFKHPPAFYWPLLMLCIAVPLSVLALYFILTTSLAGAVVFASIAGVLSMIALGLSVDGRIFWSTLGFMVLPAAINVWGLWSDFGMANEMTVVSAIVILPYIALTIYVIVRRKKLYGNKAAKTE